MVNLWRRSKWCRDIIQLEYRHVEHFVNIGGLNSKKLNVIICFEEKGTRGLLNPRDDDISAHTVNSFISSVNKCSLDLCPVNGGSICFTITW